MNQIAGTPVVNGDVSSLSEKVLKFIEDAVKLCKPDKVYFCDGSETENARLIKQLHEQGTLIPLPKYKNCWLARTNPADCARVESRTFNCSAHKEDSIPTPKKGIVGKLGNWISPAGFDKVNFSFSIFFTNFLIILLVINILGD